MDGAFYHNLCITFAWLYKILRFERTNTVGELFKKQLWQAHRSVSYELPMAHNTHAKTHRISVVKLKSAKQKSKN